MQERAPSRIYFVHFAYLASFLRLASPDSFAEIFSCGGEYSCIILPHYAYWKFHRAVKKTPVLSGDR